MSTSFSSLPIIDLSILSSLKPPHSDLEDLSKQLHDVFATTGFAYLINCPLTFSHEDVFCLAREFFGLTRQEKMRLAKKSFVACNKNTYRGYFPPQPGQEDNLKEGFEVGPSYATPSRSTSTVRLEKFKLDESNVWPAEESFPNGRSRLEKLHGELQILSSTLLSLLAVSLGKSPDFFSSYLQDSLSTLRLLHYPPQPERVDKDEIKLCCTPHTDSGILTLLQQDPTGGLEVLNASGEWIAAPYVPNSLVVNIGDLLAAVSGGRFVATMHRVRTNASGGHHSDGIGRLSVPFFFEPGERCVIESIDGGDGVVYGDHVRKKMSSWVEFQDVPMDKIGNNTASAIAMEA